ncbi:MAG: endo alpha-1,4 polygalactosaminidase [Myxococcales bacterium]
MRSPSLLLALSLGAACNAGSDPGHLDAGLAPDDAGMQAQMDAATHADASDHERDASQPGKHGDAGTDAAVDLALPPINAGFDYQLGGGYPPPSGVGIVSRDRTDEPAKGLFNVCYVNGFQVQPGEEQRWAQDLILRDAAGNAIIDPDWNEALLDVSTADKRTRIAAMLNGFMDGCANAGFDAVEIDNLDSYARSKGKLTQANAVALMALLSGHAHSRGLAIAQKNSTELLARRAEMGTDFAVAEECSRYDECKDYVDAYGSHVLMIEYRKADFDKGCKAYGSTHSIVLRDLDLVPKGQAGYLFDDC